MFDFNFTIILVVISFVLFMILLGKIFWEPLSSILEEREQLFLGLKESAEAKSKEASDILSNNEEKVLSLRISQQEELDKLLRDAKDSFRVSEKEALEELNKEFEKQQGKLLSHRKDFTSQSRQQSLDFAQLIYKKVVDNLA